MSQALYRKWRSQTFSEVVGQEPIIRTLRNALREGRLAHAYLFAGPRGTGKTSTARILAKALNCTAAEEDRPCNHCPTCLAITEGRMIDLIEIDAASNNSVDDVRELRERVGFQPSEGQYKVYIIDEVHMLSIPAFNALLKTLEEPPPHARFVLATTEPNKIPATIISRCQRFDFRRIPILEIVDHLTHIVGEEGFRAQPEALTAIALSAQGCMRDALSLLDQMLSFGVDEITVDQVRQVLGVVDVQAVTDLVQSLATHNVGDGLRLIRQLVLDGANLPEFTAQLVEHLRHILVVQMTGDPALLAEVPGEVVARVQEQAGALPAGQTLYAVKRLSGLMGEFKNSQQPQLLLELAFVELAGGQATPPAAPVALSAATTPTPEAAPPAPPPSPEPAAQTAAQTAAQAAATPETPTEDRASSPAQSAPSNPQAESLIRQRWKDFLGQVRDQCGYQVQAALNTVRDVAIADRFVAFSFGNNGFTRDMVAKPENLQAVAQILGQILGYPVQLDCQMGESAEIGGLAAVTDTGSRDGPDPLVDYAVQDLGAEIVESE